MYIHVLTIQWSCEQQQAIASIVHNDRLSKRPQRYAAVSIYSYYSNTTKECSPWDTNSLPDGSCDLPDGVFKSVVGRPWENIVSAT